MQDFTPFELLRQLTPLARTLVHEDNAVAMQLLNHALPNFAIKRIASGTSVWTWQVPNQWHLISATIREPNSGKILWDGTSHPLATVNYSLPFNGIISAEQLNSHLHTHPTRPSAIPFIYRFYNRDWGFCMPLAIKEKILQYPQLAVEIVTNEQPGELLVGECVLPGSSTQELLIVSNICHPGTANDSISGAVAAVDLARYLATKSALKYTYRFLFLPETIGSIAYLAQHPQVIKNAVGGFFSEMLGNDNSHCLQLTRHGATYLDQVALSVLKDFGKPYRVAPFLMSAANDEKVLDSPGVNIPTLSLTRYPYPEYHSSDDNEHLINTLLLNESCALIRELFDRLERDYVPHYLQQGPVCLAAHDLYPDWYKDPSLKPQWEAFVQVMYALDNQLSCEQLAVKLNLPVKIIYYWMDAFTQKNFVKPTPYLMPTCA